MDRITPLVVATLEELIQPKGILARNDGRTRELEGLERRVDVLSGDVPETIDIVENGITYGVDVRRGQKTGLFLDQRREPGGGRTSMHAVVCSIVSATTEDSRWRWADSATRRSRSTFPKTPSGVSGRMPKGMRSSSTPAWATCSTNCADSNG